jgi:hypothetical protein
LARGPRRGSAPQRASANPACAGPAAAPAIRRWARPTCTPPAIRRRRRRVVVEDGLYGHDDGLYEHDVNWSAYCATASMGTGAHVPVMARCDPVRYMGLNNRPKWNRVH